MNSFVRVLCVVSMLAVTFAASTEASPGRGTLYGTDASGGNLLDIDRSTGIATVIGPTGFAFPSLAGHPTSGTLYAVRAAGAPELYTLDPSTGAATPVGDTGLGFASVGGLDFAANGTLYASANIAGDGGTGSDHLATIDITTGAATVIGPFGTCTGITIPSTGGGSCDLEGMESIAFDEAGVLWGTVSARGAAGMPGLYVINPATGAATHVAPLLESSTLTPASGGFVSLQFACDGTLYGGTARAQGAATDGGFLAEIDPATGLFTYLGPIPAAAGTSLGGLAFARDCPEEIPSLGSLGLLLLAGVLLILGWSRIAMR